jgi:hypothetical protein
MGQGGQRHGAGQGHAGKVAGQGGGLHFHGDNSCVRSEAAWVQAACKGSTPAPTQRIQNVALSDRYMPLLLAWKGSGPRSA